MTASSPAGRAKLRWRCRRGMQELDRLLGGFLDRGYDALTPGEQRCFLGLLETEDDRLWDWLTGRDAPPDREMARLVRKIRACGSG